MTQSQEVDRNKGCFLAKKRKNTKWLLKQAEYIRYAGILSKSVLQETNNGHYTTCNPVLELQEKVTTMEKTTAVDSISMQQRYTDILYLTNRDQVPPEIKQLLKQHNLSFMMLPTDKFPKILNQLELVGTVIIDVQNLDVSQPQQNLNRIIESLETRNIGTILLSVRETMPVKSFSLAGPQVKSFSLATTMESVSLDELWLKISVNLAYRKKSSTIFAKPMAPPTRVKNNYGNRLAEQLSMTRALVENLTEHLRMAGLVQRDFLPAKLPNSDEVQWATVFLPAEWVSGDIYDIVRIDEQHIGFYVADAVGHSMPAALLTIFLKQALVMKETVKSNYRIISPAEVMQQLNKRVTAQKLSGYQFATCCYCLLNTKTLQLTYARSGHPYPILIRKNEPPKQLETRGSLLGIFEHADFVQQTIQLQQGDKFILCSDGAESFVGNFDETKGFGFSEEFSHIKDKPLAEMYDEFNTIIKNKEIDPYEIDDITSVGLEIL